MSTKHKQTITFTSPQATYLIAKSEHLGISFAEMVRRVVDEYRKASMNGSFGLPMTRSAQRAISASKVAAYADYDVPDVDFDLVLKRDIEFKEMINRVRSEYKIASQALNDVKEG